MPLNPTPPAQTDSRCEKTPEEELTSLKGHLKENGFKVVVKRKSRKKVLNFGNAPPVIQCSSVDNWPALNRYDALCELKSMQELETPDRVTAECHGSPDVVDRMDGKEANREVKGHNPPSGVAVCEANPESKAASGPGSHQRNMMDTADIGKIAEKEWMKTGEAECECCVHPHKYSHVPTGLEDYDSEDELFAFCGECETSEGVELLREFDRTSPGVLDPRFLEKDCDYGLEFANAILDEILAKQPEHDDDQVEGAMRCSVRGGQTV